MGLWDEAVSHYQRLVSTNKAKFLHFSQANDSPFLVIVPQYTRGPWFSAK